MAKLEYGVSPTSVILRVKLMNSSVTTGAGLTGLTSASSGLVISTIKLNEATPTTYTSAGSTIESVSTLGTYAAPTATKCRFREVDATNNPGVYEIQLADARFSSTDALLISISGATNLAQADIEVQCTNRPSNVVQIGGQTASASGTVTFPNATLASTTNITAGTMTTVTNLTNERSKYMGGQVWISSAGAAGTASYTNGIMTNPVTGIADAKTIADNLLLKKFYTQAGTTVTLVATMNGYVFDGWGWVLALGGQQISNSVFMNCRSITGVSSSSGATAFPVFINSEFGATATIPPSNVHHCEFGGTVTLAASGNYDFVDCCSVVAGTSTPIFDVNSVANVNISFRRWSGGITINNIVATSVISIDVVSGGTVTLNGVGGNVQVRGMAANVVDNRTGSPTLGQTAVVNQTTVGDCVWDELLTGATHNIATSAGRRLRQLASQTIWEGVAQGPGTNGNQIVLDTGASSVDGSYDPSVIAIVGGTGSGQCRLILQYAGASRTATVDRDWKVLPDATSEFIIYANPGREHVNEGLAQAGGASTITLNASASNLNDNYVGQLIFIRSGTGQDQVRLCTAYVGLSKVATVSEPWGTIPDTTSGYVVLPNHIHEVLVNPAYRLQTDINGYAMANTVAIANSTIAADQLNKTTITVKNGTVYDGVFTPTTTQFECSPLGGGTTLNHFAKRTVIFTSGTLANQAREILASSYTGGRTLLTVVALSVAPSNGDTFIIV